MRLKVYGISLSGLLIALLLGICVHRPSVAAAETLKIGGVGTALGSMKLIAAAFEKVHPEISIVIIPSLGSSGAAAAVHKGALDIGLMGRELRSEEAGLGLKVVEYARTPFVAVTHTDAVLREVTTEDLVKIFRGDTRTWPNGKPIRIVLRLPSDSDTLLAKTISPEMDAALDRAHSREGMLTAVTDQDNAALIERTPGAIGFSTLTQIMAEHRTLRILPLNGVTPSVKSLASGSYHFFKPLFLVTKAESPGSIKKLVDFVMKTEGKRILEATGNLPVRTR